jgi:membrane protein DedA with SNARE-associated domain/membrane-associated phospholipid phosphatase
LEHLTTWINQYGYGVLLVALILELLALPLPGEAVMSYAGLLVYQGKLNWIVSILAAFSGSIIGMTLSYWIGFKLGTPFFHKYGHYVHLGPERLEKVSRWFSRYGNKLLVIAYFIPGIRHFTGYFSGINRLPFRTFALYAYTGAFIWTATFITLGKVLGPQWEHFHGVIKKYLIIAGIVAAVAIVLYVVYRNNKEQIKETLTKTLSRLVNTFHSLGRVRFLVTAVLVIGVFLFIAMISLIQDFLANEFRQFDEVVSILVPLFFTPTWISFSYWASLPVLISFGVLSLVGIFLMGKNRRIETLFLFFVFLGAEFFEEALRRIFHRLPPLVSHTKPLSYTFPSEYTLMATVVYGFTAFLLFRHLKSRVGKLFVSISFFLVLVLIGISRLYIREEYPSDVVAGYVFGGVWLSLNIVLLEINRLLYKVKDVHS